MICSRIHYIIHVYLFFKELSSLNITFFCLQAFPVKVVTVKIGMLKIICRGWEPRCSMSCWVILPLLYLVVLMNWNKALCCSTSQPIKSFQNWKGCKKKQVRLSLYVGLWKVFKVRYQIERYANIHVHVESTFIWYGILHFINQLSIPFLGRSEVRKNKQWVGKITCTITKHGRLFYHVLTLFYYTLEWI